MAKSQTQKPQNKQLELRVFGQIEGGRSGEVTIHPPTPSFSPCEQRTASAEDQAIYQAIADKYFESER